MDGCSDLKDLGLVKRLFIWVCWGTKGEGDKGKGQFASHMVAGDGAQSWLSCAGGKLSLVRKQIPGRSQGAAE